MRCFVNLGVPLRRPVSKMDEARIDWTEEGLTEEAKDRRRNGGFREARPMAKSHGARQQKKLAKQKAKRAEKHSHLVQSDSKDPTIRLRQAEKWPVVQALVGEGLWNDGIGYLVLARQEGEGRLIFAFFLVDVYCLGVKNTFWEAGSSGDFKDYVRKLEKSQSMISIAPACLAKIVQGAV